MSVQEVSTVQEARSEADVAAETLAVILLTGMFGQDETMVARCVQAVGIDLPDLKRAVARIQARGYHPPARRPVAVDADAVPMTQRVSEPCEGCGESFVRTLGTARPRRFCYTCKPTANRVPEGDTRKCKRCGVVKPIDEFLPRTDSNSRRTECDDCRKLYSRRRYLSIDTSERLGTILRFLAEDGDPCIGDTCPRCHNAIEVGQEVETDEVVLAHHARCPDSLTVASAKSLLASHGQQGGAES